MKVPGCALTAHQSCGRNRRCWKIWEVKGNLLLSPEAGQFRMGAKVPESAVGGCVGLFGVTYLVFHAS